MSPNTTLEMPTVEDTMFGEQRVTKVDAQSDPEDFCFCICSCWSRRTRTTNSQLITAGAAAGK